MDIYHANSLDPFYNLALIYLMDSLVCKTGVADTLTSFNHGRSVFVSVVFRTNTIGFLLIDVLSSIRVRGQSDARY